MTTSLSSRSRITDERAEFPDARFNGAELPGDWYLVVANRAGPRLQRDDVLGPLSAGCEVITGDVEEHVMVSMASGWRDGVRRWLVMHDAGNGREHLEIEGELPGGFDAVRERILALRREENDDAVDDYFEIPVEWARELTGYHHDAPFQDDGDARFEVLADARPPFWKRLLG
jgi:hypothetical protein